MVGIGEGADTDTSKGPVAATDTVTVTDPSSPAFWAAAAQRHPISAVTRWVTGMAATALLGRRRPASLLEQPSFIALSEGCPVSWLCGARGGAGRSYRHNYVPGTPR